MCEYPRNDATIPPRGLHESGTRSGIVVKEFDRGVGQVCFAVRCRGHRRRQGTATREWPSTQTRLPAIPFRSSSSRSPRSARPSPRHSSSCLHTVASRLIFSCIPLLPSCPHPLWCLANFPSVIARQVSRTRCWFSRFLHGGGMRGISGRVDR